MGYQGDVGNSLESVDVHEARRQIAGGDAVAVDVRSEEEWQEGHVPGAIHLPGGEVGVGVEVEDGSRLMVITDESDASAQAASRLRESGFDPIVIDGGMGDWISEGFQIQPTPDPDEDTELGLK
jgi:rhodanese-related sulfurtransferase